jgi:hypothetical protein
LGAKAVQLEMSFCLGTGREAPFRTRVIVMGKWLSFVGQKGNDLFPGKKEIKMVYNSDYEILKWNTSHNLTREKMG